MGKRAWRITAAVAGGIGALSLAAAGVVQILGDADFAVHAAVWIAAAVFLVVGAVAGIVQSLATTASESAVQPDTPTRISRLFEAAKGRVEQMGTYLRHLDVGRLPGSQFSQRRGPAWSDLEHQRVHRRGEVDDVLSRIANMERAVIVAGAPGTGKTVLLRYVGFEMERRGETVWFQDLAVASDAHDLAERAGILVLDNGHLDPGLVEFILAHSKARNVIVGTREMRWEAEPRGQERFAAAYRSGVFLRSAEGAQGLIDVYLDCFPDLRPHVQGELLGELTDFTPSLWYLVFALEAIRETVATGDAPEPRDVRRATLDRVRRIVEHGIPDSVGDPNASAIILHLAPFSSLEIGISEAYLVRAAPQGPGFEVSTLDRLVDHGELVRQDGRISIPHARLAEIYLDATVSRRPGGADHSLPTLVRGYLRLVPSESFHVLDRLAKGPQETAIVARVLRHWDARRALAHAARDAPANPEAARTIAMILHASELFATERVVIRPVLRWRLASAFARIVSELPHTTAQEIIGGSFFLDRALPFPIRGRVVSLLAQLPSSGTEYDVRWHWRHDRAGEGVALVRLSEDIARATSPQDRIAALGRLSEAAPLTPSSLRGGAVNIVLFYLPFALGVVPWFLKGDTRTGVLLGITTACFCALLFLARALRAARSPRGQVVEAIMLCAQDDNRAVRSAAISAAAALQGSIPARSRAKLVALAAKDLASGRRSSSRVLQSVSWLARESGGRMSSTFKPIVLRELRSHSLERRRSAATFLATIRSLDRHVIAQVEVELQGWAQADPDGLATTISPHVYWVRHGIPPIVTALASPPDDAPPHLIGLRLSALGALAISGVEVRLARDFAVKGLSHPSELVRRAALDALARRWPDPGSAELAAREIHAFASRARESRMTTGALVAMRALVIAHAEPGVVAQAKAVGDAHRSRSQPVVAALANEILCELTPIRIYTRRAGRMLFGPVERIFRSLA